MTHLDKQITQVNLFETRVTESRSDDTAQAQQLQPAPFPRRELPLVVGPDMTPEQMRETLSSNWGGNDSMFVKNLPPRTKGHHY